jgi:hypothetical protein
VLCLWLWPVGARGAVDAAWLGVAIGGGGIVFTAAARVVAPPEYEALRGILPRRGRR